MVWQDHLVRIFFVELMDTQPVLELTFQLVSALSDSTVNAPSVMTHASYTNLQELDAKVIVEAAGSFVTDKSKGQVRLISLLILI